MDPERQPNPESEASKVLTPEQLDEVRIFVNGPLQEYLLQHETDNELFRKAGISAEGETADLIANGGDKERVIAMPPARQQELYQKVAKLKGLLEIGAGEGN